MNTSMLLPTFEGSFTRVRSVTSIECPLSCDEPLTAASALVVALTLTGSAAAGNGGFAPVPPQSPNAEDIQTIYWSS